jgi:glycine cleavage system H protein
MVALFVMTAFLLILIIDMIVLRMEGKYHPAFEPTSPQYELPILNGKNYSIPSDIYISKGHTWYRNNKNGLIDIGIDEFGATALGKLSVIKFAEMGKELKRGDVVFEGTYGNNPIKFLSPINGTVNSVNTYIINNEIAAPYRTWGVQLSPNENSINLELFFSGEKAANWLSQEFNRLKNFIEQNTPNVAVAGETMYDGGLPNNNSITSMDDKAVNNFEKEFLSL